MFTAALIAAALLAEVTPSAAQPATPAGASPASAGTPQTAAPKPDEDPMICRSEAVIGSRLPVRTCMRKSARELLTRRSREAAEEVQTRSRGPFHDKP